MAYIDQQSQLVREVIGQQERSQAILVQELMKGWRLEKAPTDTGSPLSRTPWPLLTKLGAADDVDAYFKALKCTAKAAKFGKDQWAFLIGPYLSGEALAALKALEKTEALIMRN